MTAQASKLNFVSTLTSHERGAVLDEATAQLIELAKAVRETGKAGSITLKLKLSPSGKGRGRALVRDVQVTSSLPKPERPLSIVFVDDDGSLSTANPDQMTMELKTVAETQPVKKEELKTVTA